MTLKELKKLISQLVQEYTGTGASGGNATDGNDITSPRVGGSFLTDEDEIEDYMYKSIYGGDGGHYKYDVGPINYNHLNKPGMFELKNYIKEILKEIKADDYGSATLTTQGQYKSRFTKTGKPPGIMDEQNNPYKMGEHPDFQLLIKTATEDLGLKVDETVRGGSYNGKEGYYLRIDYRDLSMWEKEQVEILKKTFDKVNEITEEFTFEFNNVSDRDDEPGERIIEASFSFFAESKFKKQYMSKISPEDFKNKIKVGRKVKYMGGSYTVVNNDGFVLELEDEEGNKKTVNLNQFSHGGMVTEQISKAEQQTYERGLKRLQKNVLRYQLRFIEKQRAASISQAATAGQQAQKGFDEQIKALQDQIDAIDNPPEPQKEHLVKEYFKSRENINLMTHIDLYKQSVLLEGTMKKFFTLFEKGKTNEEVLRHYANKGITIPESFLSKIRKQYEGLKKQKLEIGFSEQEAKDILYKPTIPQAQLFDMGDEDEGLYQEKKLMSKLRKEGKDVKKYPIPPEIEDALVNQLKMNPLIRFVKNLKALNSIPPAYRIFLLNGKHFDIYYEEFSLMAKINKTEYYLANLDERNYAIKHINRLMTEPILKTGDEEETTPTTPTPPSPPPPPPSPEPEEPEA